MHIISLFRPLHTMCWLTSNHAKIRECAPPALRKHVCMQVSQSISRSAISPLCQASQSNARTQIPPPHHTDTPNPPTRPAASRARRSRRPSPPALFPSGTALAK